MATVKDLIREQIVIRFDDPAQPNKWTSVALETVKHVYEDDGSDDYGEILKIRSWNSNNFSSAEQKLPARIYTYLVNNAATL